MRRGGHVECFSRRRGAREVRMREYGFESIETSDLSTALHCAARCAAPRSDVQRCAGPRRAARSGYRRLNKTIYNLFAPVERSAVRSAHRPSAALRRVPRLYTRSPRHPESRMRPQVRLFRVAASTCHDGKLTLAAIRSASPSYRDDRVSVTVERRNDRRTRGGVPSTPRAPASKYFSISASGCRRS